MFPAVVLEKNTLWKHHARSPGLQALDKPPSTPPIMMFTNVLGLVATATVGLGASLQQVSSWGANPTKIQMFIYVPDKLAASPPVVVAVSAPFPASAPSELSGLTAPHSSTPAVAAGAGGSREPPAWPRSPTSRASSSSTPARPT